MNAICTKCLDIYEAPETRPLEPLHLCQRCSAVAELLAASDALNQRIKAELSLGRLNVALVRRSHLAPAIERADRAIASAKARAL